MEYTQWVKKSVDEWAIKNVLILVVMEYTQWGGTISWSWKMQGLNPCCNGIYSMRFWNKDIRKILKCVLILVVMEYTQWASESNAKTKKSTVLILVVMEYTQWVKKNRLWKKSFCLNPCCNGIYSMSPLLSGTYATLGVLILVVMEYTQWAIHRIVR